MIPLVYSAIQSTNSIATGYTQQLIDGSPVDITRSGLTYHQIRKWFLQMEARQKLNSDKLQFGLSVEESQSDLADYAEPGPSTSNVNNAKGTFNLFSFTILIQIRYWH